VPSGPQGPPAKPGWPERLRREARQRPPRPAASWRIRRTAIQLAIAAAILLAWQYLPEIGWVTGHVKWTSRFFISSPASVAHELSNLATGHDTQGITLWPYLEQTVVATVAGSAIGLVLGALAGLVLSNSPRASQVLQPFVIVANSIPRIAIIPVVILIAKPTTNAEIITIVLVVFFLAFFNALEGGRSVSQAMLDNARLLGARPLDIMQTKRLPVVLQWTFATVPNAVSFGLIVAVTTELLAGLPGMGSLLQAAMQNIDSSYTFAIVVVLAIVGLLLSLAARKLRDALIRWDRPDDKTR
jgi:NitT/TauT family transport system permease protein